MANPTVTNTYTDGAKLSSADINQNFTDCVNAVTDGAKDLSISSMAVAGKATGNFTLNSAFTLSVYPVSLAKCVGERVVWKTVAAITVKAGYYWINGKVQQLDSDTDWSWTLDTGAEGNNWYYLYLADVSGTLTAVASLTSPTALWDTNLSGATYDTNIYLCAFQNSGGDIVKFMQCGNHVMQLDKSVNQGTIAAVAFPTVSQIDVSSFVPATAMFSDITVEADLPSNYLGALIPRVYDASVAANYNVCSIWSLDSSVATQNFSYLFPSSATTMGALTLGQSMTISYLGWYDRWMV